MTETFGDTLKGWRKKRLIKRVYLSAFLRVPYRTLEDWEAGRHTPNSFVQNAVLKRLQDWRKRKTLALRKSRP